MKKILALTLTVFMMMLAGCGDNQDTKKENSEPAKKVADDKIFDSDKSDKKILIAYFSRAGDNYEVGVIEKGNTKIVAEMIAETTGGDMFEIKPVKAYPADYHECTEVAKAELQADARPEIADKVANFEQYNTIFLGYPNWLGDMPMIVYTFLESYDFAGKTVIPFCTSSSDNMTGKEKDITLHAKNAVTHIGIGIKGKLCQDEPEMVRQKVNQWLKNLNY